MAFEYDEQARREATERALSEQQAAELSALVGQKRRELGPEGVRGHRVRYDRDKWSGILPGPLAKRDFVTRGDVFDLAETGDYTAVFTASFVWGTGPIGYGPHRYRQILNSAGGQLDEMLRTAVDAAADDLIAGYTMLYGGHDAKTRAPAGRPPWVRISHFGPAFFTKFLYFTTAGALILDNVLARAVTRLGGVPYLVRPNGNSYDWSPYRYAVYVHWMRQSASRLGCDPDELEVTLFAPPTSSRRRLWPCAAVPLVPRGILAPGMGLQLRLEYLPRRSPPRWRRRQPQQRFSAVGRSAPMIGARRW